MTESLGFELIGSRHEFTGTAYRIILCKGALKSLQSTLGHVEHNKAKSLVNSIRMQLDRLADGHQMSQQNFPVEGNLPKFKNNDKALKFRALKKRPLRGYCWKSQRHKDTWFISHFIFKNTQKLSTNDTDKICQNWKRIEELGHEH